MGLKCSTLNSLDVHVLTRIDIYFLTDFSGTDFVDDFSDSFAYVWLL